MTNMTNMTTMTNALFFPIQLWNGTNLALVFEIKLIQYFKITY